MNKNGRSSPAEIKYAAAVFKALGHPERLRIVCALSEHGPCTQTQLVETLGRPQSSLARHLVPLRSLGLVTGERDGLEVPLALSTTLTQDLLHAVCAWMHPAAGRRDATNHLLASERKGA